MAVFGEILPRAFCRNPRSAAGDVLEADAYLQCSLKEWLFHAPHRLCFQRHPGHARMFQLPGSRRPMRQLSAGYAAWKQEFAGEARAKGVSAATIQALMATNYAQATINADRGQRSFQSLARSVSRQARAPRPSSRRGGSSRRRRARCSLRSSSATACRRGRCSRSGGWRPGSAPARQPEHARLDRDARL